MHSASFSAKNDVGKSKAHRNIVVKLTFRYWRLLVAVLTINLIYFYFKRATTNEDSKIKYSLALYDRIQRRPNMYVKLASLAYPVILFSDAFIGKNCVIITSRYHGDGREDIKFEDIAVRFSLTKIKLSESYISIDQHFTAKEKKVYKSNAKGLI